MVFDFQGGPCRFCRLGFSFWVVRYRLMKACCELISTCPGTLPSYQDFQTLHCASVLLFQGPPTTKQPQPFSCSCQRTPIQLDQLSMFLDSDRTKEAKPKGQKLGFEQLRKRVPPQKKEQKKTCVLRKVTAQQRHEKDGKLPPLPGCNGS